MVKNWSHKKKDVVANLGEYIPAKNGVTGKKNSLSPTL